MSISAKVESVHVDENGGGHLLLIQGPARNPIGQRILRFKSAPEEVTALNGREVWGGSGDLMLGEKEIAKRIGYTRIEFVDREKFLEAIHDG